MLVPWRVLLIVVCLLFYWMSHFLVPVFVFCDHHHHQLRTEPETPFQALEENNGNSTVKVHHQLRGQVVYLPFRKQGLGYIQTVVGNGISEPSICRFDGLTARGEIDSSQCHEAKCFLRMPQW